MPQADGTILIDTEINADGMKAGSKEVEAAVRRMASSVNDLGTKAKTALNKQVDAFSKLNSEFATQSRKVDELKKKVAEYGKQKIPTAEYKEIQAQIDQASQKMNRLISAQKKFLAMGGSKNSKQYKKYQYDIDELANSIRYAKGEMKDLEATGKAFTLGNQTKQAAADMEKLAAAERKLSDMNNRLGTSYSSIKGQVNDYKNNLLRADSAQRKASESGNRLSKSLNNAGKSAKSAQFGIGRMLGTSILFSFVFQAINGAVNALASGFTNLAQYSGSTNNSISMLWSSLERLKNSLATAFAPILDVIAPILSKFIDMISTAASYVSMFFAFLSGKSTYTRAVAVQKDYAASLADTAGSAAEAADGVGDVADNALQAAEDTEEAAESAEDYLSPLDDINRYTKENEDLSKPSGSGGNGSGSPGGGSGSPGGGGAGGSGPLFEEVPIDNKFASLLESVLDKLKEIRDIFMSGFWDGLGDYKPLLEELKRDLSSIGKYLADIFTDADVQAAAKRFSKSFIYNLGKIAGSFARIGLAIAVNIVGGIESYLSENVDRIKNYLVTMFDVGTEVNTLLGNLASTVAEIFSDVFGSQVAQDITGDIIGIFTEAFMLVTMLGASFGRDLLNMIVQPLMENKEAIKTALLETLQPIQTITQAIETFLQSITDKIMALYNEHIKPFIDSITQGISDIVGTFLAAYNEYIAPILDAWAAKFDEVLNGPVLDAIDSFLSVIGKVIDVLKLLWEEVLVPLIEWIIENIIPVIAPIVEWIGTTALDLVGTVAEMASGILDALGGIIDFLVGVFTGDWDKAFSGLKQIADGFKKTFNAIFDFIQNNVLTSFGNFLSGAFEQNWVESFGVFGYAIEGFLSTVQNIFDGVKRIFNGLIDFINGVFSGDWSRAWRGVVEIFGGIWDTIGGFLSGPINTVISFLNALLDGVERAQNWIAEALSFNISLPGPIAELTGWSGFYLSIPKWSLPNIPYLASGAVIPPNKEFMAVLGDQKQGNNIEAPEGLIRRIVREESGRSGGNKYEIPLKVGRRELARLVIDEAKLMRVETGKNPFELA